MFSRAIVRTPGKSLVNGLTTAQLGAPDYEKALAQHHAYIQALRECGLDVTVMPADEAHPDSTFVEDAALLTPHCAIITNPGAPSRRGEIDTVKTAAQQFYSSIEQIHDPGTVEAGDIMMVDDHYYIGLSQRTNRKGAEQLIQILQKYGMSGSMIHLDNVLHLKTGIAYLENNNLIVCREFVNKEEFDPFNKIEIPDYESYAANCIWINGTVIIPSGYPVTCEKITALDYNVIETDMSEFQKLDGGLSCLSLRF